MISAPLLDSTIDNGNGFRLLDLPPELLMTIFDSVCKIYPLLIVNKKIHATAIRVLYSSARIPDAAEPLPRVNKVCYDTCFLKSKYEGPASLMTWAACKRYLQSMGYLQHISGLSLETPDECSLTPLHHAALRGEIEVVEYLISRGVNVDPKTDRLAMYNSKNIRRHEWCSWATSQRPCKRAWWSEGWGTTPLHLAAEQANVRVVSLLLGAGADVMADSDHSVRKETTTKASIHYKALQAAALGGSVEIVGIILDHCKHSRADIWDAQLAAISEDLEDVFLVLFKHAGRSVDECIANPICECDPQACGHSPLHTAIKYGADSIVRYLIKQGANIELRDPFNHTPVFNAVMRPQPSEMIIRILVEHGANTYDSDSCQWLGIMLKRGWLDGSVESLNLSIPFVYPRGPIINRNNGLIASILWKAIPVDTKKDWWMYERVNMYVESGRLKRNLTHVNYNLRHDQDLNRGWTEIEKY